MTVFHQTGTTGNREDEIELTDDQEAARKASLLSKEPFIDVARRAVDTMSYQWLRGAMVDTFSANIVVQIFDALKPDKQAKLLSFDPVRAHLMCIELYNRVTSGR